MQPIGEGPSRAMGLPANQRESAGVSADVKQYICDTLKSCGWSVGCAFGKSNADRKKDADGDGKNDWNDPVLRPAENFLYAASYDDVSTIGVLGHAALKLARWPLGVSTPPSGTALQAGLEGINHQNNTQVQWEKWCSK